MATYYWVNTLTGSQSWDGGSNWSTSSGGTPGSTAPTSADDVVFDNNSGHATSSQTISWSTSSVCKSFTITSRTRGQIIFADSNYLQVYGSISFNASSNAQVSTGNAYLWFKGSTGGNISSGINLPKLYFDGTASWNQNSALTLYGAAGSSLYKDLIVNQGTFSTAGFTLTAGNLTSTNTANARTVKLNASTVVLKGSAPLYLDQTNLSYSDLAASITVDGTDTSSGVTILAYGLTINSLTASRSSSSLNVTIGNGITFGSLTLNATSLGITQFLVNTSTTITGTFTCSGSSANSRGMLKSTVGATAVTVSAATTSITNFDFQDITASGGASWSGTRVGDAKGNTGITFSTPKNVYWSYVGSANWSDTVWATSSGGTAAANNFPLPQDTAIFDDAGLSSGATVTLDKEWNMPTVTATAVTSAKPFTFYCGSVPGSSVLYFYGGFEVNANMTRSFAGSAAWSFLGRTTQNFAQPYSGTPIGTQPMVSASYGSTINLTGNVLVGDITINYSSTFTANSYDVKCSTYTQNFGATGNLGSGTWTLVGATGGTVWNVNSSSTLNSSTSTIYVSGSNAVTFAGGNRTYFTLYNDVANALGLTVTGANTFNTLASTANTRAMYFTAGTTTTVTNFNINGTSSQSVNLYSTTSSPFTLSKSSGTVNASYLNIYYSTATGGATWNATNSTDLGGNTGWNFIPANTGFLVFF